jgi:hypothetical protein
MAETKKKKYIITVNRQFGSLGRPAAEKAAELLGIEFYDRDIVERAAKSANISVHEASELDEKPASFFRMQYPLGMGPMGSQDAVFKAQRQFIIDRASVESCIIVGRCSDFILKDMPDLLRLYIYGSYQHRLSNCVHDLHMENKDAMRMIRSVDKARDKFHQEYAGYLPSDRDHCDVQLSSDGLTVNELAAMIAQIAKVKFGLN